MTFRLDSDVSYVYGKIVDADTNHIISPLLKNRIKWKRPDNETSLVKIYKNKTEGIAQFTSHCVTFSKRHVLVEKLRKYLNVDVYGNCGKFK